MPELISLSQWAALHGKDTGNVRKLIQQGRIPAQKIGAQWVIAADVLPPADGRVKSGQYRGWRKAAKEPPED